MMANIIKSLEMLKITNSADRHTHIWLQTTRRTKNSSLFFHFPHIKTIQQHMCLVFGRENKKKERKKSQSCLLLFLLVICNVTQIFGCYLFISDVFNCLFIVIEISFLRKAKKKNTHKKKRKTP